MNALLELLNSDLPLALAVIVAGVILLQIVPALRTYLLSHVQTQLNANLRQEVTDVIQGLMETMDEYDAVFDVAMKMIRAKYPRVNPDELEVKIRASLSEVLMWIDPESDRSADRNRRALRRSTPNR